jgi:hypothetical protein
VNQQIITISFVSATAFFTVAPLKNQRDASKNRCHTQQATDNLQFGICTTIRQIAYPLDNAGIYF